MGPASDPHTSSSGPPADGVFGFGPFEFDPASGLLYRGEEEVLLPPRAAALLGVFLRRPGVLLSKSELLDAVWKDAFVGEDSLTQALSIIRHALDDDPRQPSYIETRWKRGYRFIAGVTRPARGRPDPVGAHRAAVPAVPGSATAAGAGVHVKVGDRLGHYTIRGDLGAGAMGVVYRAWDTILERDVAIKVLPRAFVANPDRVASLEREARLLAALSHPNIASVYSLERFDGLTFPVMELVEGATLAERLRSEAVTIKEALDVCRQVAAGLEAAHERGIVHRDLKPANIKVTPKGQAKVLDFGLATSVSVDRYQLAGTGSPTESVGLVGSYRGAIVGTVAYMSPEQARGQEADARSDIWSFGCVLYEALTGQPAFRRKTVAGTLHAIAEEQPDWALLPATTPLLVRSLVRRCLRKEPDQRLRDIADARLEIEEALGEIESPRPETSTDTGAPRPAWRSALPWGIAVAAIGLAAWGLVTRPASDARAIVHLQVEVEPGLHLTGGVAQEAGPWGFLRPSRPAVALSPDGSKLVYAASNGDGRQLYLRDLGRQHAVAIQGTEGASSPFFSSDGAWIAFHANDALKKVPIDGGEARTIADGVPPPFGASWGDTGEIVFAPAETSGLLRVPAGGGVPEVLTELDPSQGEAAHRLPQLLPGGRAVLFTVLKGMFSENAEIVVEWLDTHERTVLVRGGSDGRVVPTGHLVFARQGALMAAPFSLERLAVTGEAVRVVEDLMHTSGAASTTLDSGVAQYSFSASGSLVFVPGATYPPLTRQLVWVSRDGTAQPLPFPDGWYTAPRISPDGRQIAYAAGRRAQRDVWVHDVQLGTSRRLTFDGLSGGPVWSPDGARLAYPADRGDGVWNLYAVAANGDGRPTRLTTSDQTQFASSWAPNGMLTFVEASGTMWALATEVRDAPFLLANTTFRTGWPALSPDGAWLAYTSNETGQEEVWVRAVTGAGPPVRISTEGGWGPAWSRDGTELFFRSQGLMMASRVATAGTFTHTKPRALFDASPYDQASPTRAYDVGPDGRFLMVASREQDPRPVTRIQVVLNWFDDLRQRVSSGR